MRGGAALEVALHLLCARNKMVINVIIVLSQMFYVWMGSSPQHTLMCVFLAHFIVHSTILPLPHPTKSLSLCP